MKKRTIIVCTAILLLAILITALTGGFTKGILSGKIYRPQNVYEEIWNLVLTEEHTRNQTVLTTATKDAYVDTDFGFEFVGVYIPECDVMIGWRFTNGARELSFFFLSRPDGDGDYVNFLYNYETKTLFGNEEFSFLLENFLQDYFQWCEDSADFSSDYSIESLEDVPFQYINPLYLRELSN